MACARFSVIGEFRVRFWDENCIGTCFGRVQLGIGMEERGDPELSGGLIRIAIGRRTAWPGVEDSGKHY